MSRRLLANTECWLARKGLKTVHVWDREANTGTWLCGQRITREAYPVHDWDAGLRRCQRCLKRVEEYEQGPWVVNVNMGQVVGPFETQDDAKAWVAEERKKPKVLQDRMLIVLLEKP